MFYIILILIFFFGASIGSFIAASVYRMENKKPILLAPLENGDTVSLLKRLRNACSLTGRGRSECEKCGAKLSARELIPVFSYLFLRGKCRKCGSAIDFMDFLTEIAVGALFVLAYYYHSSSVVLLMRDWIFLSALIFLFLYDKKYGFLPDIVSIPSVFIVFFLNAASGYDIWNLGLAMLAGGGFFLAQYLVSRGRWIGGGDIRMGALLGAGLGWPNVVLAIFLAYISGAFYSIPLLLEKKKKMKSRMAFGTFLAAAGVIALFWGDTIIKWYFNL